jgi:hypothetical protein
MKMVAVILSLVLLAVLPAKAQTGTQTQTKCQRLVIELHEMEKAQQAMMTSLVKKNTTIAEALNHMASDHRNLNSLTLRRSAQTFHDHQARETQLVSRFETASDQLLDQVEQCLTASPRLSANK